MLNPKTNQYKPSKLKLKMAAIETVVFREPMDWVNLHTSQRYSLIQIALKDIAQNLLEPPQTKPTLSRKVRLGKAP